MTERMSMKKISGITCSFVFFIMSAGCGTHQQLASNAPETMMEPSPPSGFEAPASRPSSVPEDGDDYQIRPVEMEIREGKPYVPVGAEFMTQQGKVDLEDVVKAMADHKGFSVSWADDVDPQRPVDCHIKAADDFYDALENILRQLDYYYEVKEDTIVIKYKETRKYHMAMPNFKETLQTGLGGDMLPGGEGETGLDATASLEINSEEFDFWEDLSTTLVNIVNCDGCPEPLIDRSLGTITITASRSVHKAVQSHLDALEKEAYKQVVIEAKIIEVALSEDYSKGIDWGDVFSSVAENDDIQGKSLGGAVGLGPPGSDVLWSKDGGWNRFLDYVTIGDISWDVVISAFEIYGDTRIVSNPKVHILNGHGAVMSAGQVIKYLEACDVSEGELGGLEYEAKIASITEGLSIGIKANVKGDDEVVLYVFPAITRLIQLKDIFDSPCGRIQAPEMAVRELATYAKVRDGEFLVIGGLIQKSDDEQIKSVPVLGDLPFLGKFFRYEAANNSKSELVIILKPRIIAAK